MMTLEIAWAAGLYEGEGHVRVASISRSGRACARLELGMTDEEVVRRWGTVIGVGHINGPYPYGDNGKAMFFCQVYGWDNIERIIELFRPYLSTRRGAQADAVLAQRPAPSTRHDRPGKLSASDRREIVQSTESGVALAERFGVSPVAISYHRMRAAV